MRSKTLSDAAAMTGARRGQAGVLLALHVLLGVYSHMIERALYLPDYPIGHLIAHQLEEHFRKAGKIGPEIERVAKLGRIAPDLWMQAASGAPVGPEALLAATERALQQVAK